MSKSHTLAEQAEALRGAEALVGDEAATELLESEAAATVPAAPKAASKDDAMGGHVARGFALMLVQSGLSRIVTMACQIALARLLLPEHWGLVTLADSVATFANVFQLIGIKEIMVGRQKRFDLWANSAFWITAAMGILTGVIVAAASPLAAIVFGEPKLPGLMYVLAVSLPIWALGLVPEARVQSQLRFRFIAALMTVQSTLQPVLTVVFALLGFGAYSFVLPRVVVGIIRTVMLFRAAKIKIKPRLQLRRWKYFIATSVLIFTTSLLLLIVQMGERPLLGLFADAHEVGLYFFAYSIGLQTVMMISVNLDAVLFAALSKLREDPERLLRGFLRASRVLAAIVTPMCLIQAAVSDAAVRTVFGVKWIEAIPSLQILGVGMMFLAVYCPANSMLQAQQRFKTRFKLSVFHCVGYVGAVLAGIIIGKRVTGTAIGAVTGLSVAVAVTYAVVSPIWTYYTTRPFGGTLATTYGIIVRPLLVSLVAVGAGLLIGEGLGRLAAGHAVAGRPVEHWVRLFGIGGFSVLIYTVLTRAFMPEQFKEVAGRIINGVRRGSPRAAGFMGRLAGLP